MHCVVLRGRVSDPAAALSGSQPKAPGSAGGYLLAETRKTRPVSLIKAALHEFESFSEDAQSICLAALTIAAEGGKADIARPLHGVGSGVFEIALAFKGDAFRVVYAVQLADEVWVLHRLPQEIDERHQDAQT